MSHNNKNTTTIEDEGFKIKLPTTVAKTIATGKILAICIGIVTALYFFMAPLYAIPNQLSAQESLLKEHTATFKTYDTKLDVLNEFKASSIADKVELRRSLKSVITGLEENTTQHNSIQVSLATLQADFRAATVNQEEIKQTLLKINLSLAAVAQQVQDGKDARLRAEKVTQEAIDRIETKVDKLTK